MSTDKPSGPARCEANQAAARPSSQHLQHVDRPGAGVRTSLWWSYNEALPRQRITYSQFSRAVGRRQYQRGRVHGLYVVGKFRTPPVGHNQERGEDGKEVETHENMHPDFSVTLSPLVGEDLDKKLLKTRSWSSLATEHRRHGPAGHRLPDWHGPDLRFRVDHVPPGPRSVHGRRHPGRLQQEPGQALRNRRTSRSRLPTWPAWRASSTTWRKSSSF